MKEDLEIKVMNEVYQALKGLDDEGRARIIDWLISRFSLQGAGGSMNLGAREDDKSGRQVVRRKINSFSSLEDVLGQAKVTKEKNKVLLVAGFIQAMQKKKELSGAEIARALRRIGQPVSNITTAIKQLTDKKPKLMSCKGEAPKGGRKRYQVTAAGLKEAELLLNPEADPFGPKP